MTHLPTDRLLRLRTEAGLGMRHQTIPLLVASLFRLRHPWCNSDVLHAIRHSKERTDEDLIHKIAEDLYIDWSAVDAYSLQRQTVADQKGIDENRVVLKFNFEIMYAVVLSMFQDRIYLLSASRQTLRKERLKTLNANWQKTVQRRKDLDPLQHWRSPIAQIWLKQPQWSREQFISLLLQLNPKKFNEEEVELSVPFSIIGIKAQQIIKKIDNAERLRFPTSRKRLLEWARENDVNVPIGMRPRQKSQAAVAAPPPSKSNVEKTLRILEQFSPGANIQFVRQHLRDVLSEVFGSKLTENQFQTKIWISIPKKLKLGHKPETEWFDAWNDILPDLRTALASVARP